MSNNYPKYLPTTAHTVTPLTLYLYYYDTKYTHAVYNTEIVLFHHSTHQSVPTLQIILYYKENVEW